MFRVCKLSGVLYAYEIDSVESAVDDIESFLSEGTAVILVPSVEDLTELFGDLEPEDVRIVADEETDDE